MSLLHFPGHKWRRCTSRYCTGCHLCHGGLALCSRCGGAEGSLPTDCPGERMSEEQDKAVYAGELDWRRETGWVNEPGVNSPTYYQRRD